MRQPLNHKGFTLLEVLVAMSIISIVFISAFKMHAMNIKLVQREKFDSVAPLLAAKQLALVEADIMEYDNASGDFKDEYASFKWQCEISDISLSDFENSDFALDEDSMEKFKKIILTISGFGKKHKYKVTTWRYFEDQ